jgi:hypothetical protein
MALPKRSEVRRLGLEVLSLLVYEGSEPAARRLIEADSDMLFGVTLYYLKALGEFVVSADHPPAVVLEAMGRRILATDHEDE